MPNKNKHLQQIESNKDFFKKIRDNYDTKFFDWKITTLFYTILHYAEALCATKGCHYRKHRERQEKLERLLPDPEYRLYLRLKNESENSRYKVRCLDSQARERCLKVYQHLYVPLLDYFERKI